MDIMIVLVVLSIVLCAVVYLHLAHITSVVEALSFTVVLMVASIPLAIEIVTTTTLALGSKELSKHGAIVTRLSAIEDMAGMAVLCSDKTGTLTLNKMQLQSECPIYSRGETQYSLLRYAAMATKWKEPPKDALDTLTLNAADLISLETIEQLEFMPFDPVVKRTEGTVRDKVTGNLFKVTKGAPHVILKMVAQPQGTGLAGMQDAQMIAKVEQDIQALGERGIRSLAVAKTPDNNTSGDVWVLLGILTFLDPPRPDTLQTIQDARKYGVEVKMITGDHILIAKETSRMLTLGTRIYPAHSLPTLDPVTQTKPDDLSATYGHMILHADGFAEVFPEHKYLIVECLREMGYKVGMTGDGVNDAPALKRADIGVAVQGATDAACAAADIVLTQPGLSTIVHGILIARCIFIRIRNFITYRIAATLQLLLFFFVAIFAFRPAEYEPEEQDNHSWPNFFHMPVIMLMLITLLNDGTLIAIGYDHVDAPKFPTVWNLRVLFVVGTVLAGVACISSLLLLYWLLDSWRKDSVFDQLGIGGISYGQITTSIFLKVAVSDFLTLFSARAGEDWFWASRPAPILMAAAGLALSVSTLLACIWPSSRPDGIPTIGLEREEPHILPVFIWIYCIIWWIIQDAAKVYTFKLLKRYDIFQYNDTGMLPTFGTSTSFYDLASLGGSGGGLSPTSSSTMAMGVSHSMETVGYDHTSVLLMEGGGVVDALDLSHVVDVGGNGLTGSSGPYTTGSTGPTSPERSSSHKYRVRSGSAGTLGTGGGGSERHYQHPNYHHHVHHPPNNNTTLSGGFINAAVAATASHIAGAQLLYGKSRNKTPVGVQYASSTSSSAATMAAPSSSMLSSAGGLFKQGKGN